MGLGRFLILKCARRVNCRTALSAGVLFAALAFAGSRCVAQQPQDDEQDGTVARLDSGDPRTVAWGAFHAANAFDPNTIAPLTRLANRWQTLAPEATNANGVAQYSEAQIEQRDVMAGVLCALIHLNAPLPADTLRALAHDFPSETAIFLARLPASESAELRMEFFRYKPNDTATLRYVAAALLAREPQPGFAPELMSGIRVRANVRVISPGASPGGEGFAACGGVPPSNAIEGWPPVRQYSLSTNSAPDSFELVGGPEAIYARRIESAHYIEHCCGSGIYLSPERRQRFVAEMLGVKPDRLAWQVEVSRTIEYTTQKQFETELLTFVNGEIEKQRATATALADKNLITPGDVTSALPEIIVSVSDEREDRTTPLEDVTNLPQRVVYDKYQTWIEE
jgi:hypothetical protein